MCVDWKKIDLGSINKKLLPCLVEGVWLRGGEGLNESIIRSTFKNLKYNAKRGLYFLFNGNWYSTQLNFAH